MELEILGHACVVLRSGGRTLLIDPYESGQFDGKMGYRPIDVAADWVACSHDHADHSAVHAVPGHPRMIEQGRHGPFEICRHRTWHDEYGGRRRGGAVDILEIRSGEATVVHLSDVGESPVESITRQLRHVDVALVPVGGFFTIGAAQAWEWIERIAPRITIPIHYRTPACGLPIDDEEAFAAWSGESFMWKECRIDVQADVSGCLIVPPRLASPRSTSPRGDA